MLLSVTNLPSTKRLITNGSILGLRQNRNVVSDGFENKRLKAPNINIKGLKKRGIFFNVLFFNALFLLAGAQGFEPQLPGPKPGVLPLYYAPIILFSFNFDWVGNTGFIMNLK